MIEGARHVTVCWPRYLREDDRYLRSGRERASPSRDDGYGRLHEFGQPFERIGLEAGPLSQWIYVGLVDVGLAAICVETRHMHAALSARTNKTDRNDARGIAQMMRVGLFLHVKTPASQYRRLLLTSRKLLQRKIYDIEIDLRGSLRNFGLKVGVIGKIKFEDRIRERVADHSLVAAIVAPSRAGCRSIRSVAP